MDKPGLRSLGSWATARFIQSLRLVAIHLWGPKNDQFFDPLHPYHLKKWTIDLLFKKKWIWKNVTNFKNLPLTFCVNITNVCSLAQITLFEFALWQILLLILPEVYCKLASHYHFQSHIWNLKSYKIKSINILSKWLLKIDSAWISYITKLRQLKAISLGIYGFLGSVGSMDN